MPLFLYRYKLNIYNKMLNKMMVLIKDIEYNLKYTLRGLFIYEKIMGKSFDGSELVNIYMLFYSLLLANNPDSFKYTFDEFISECDDNPLLFKDFIDFLNKEFEIEKQLVTKKEEDGSKKKTSASKNSLK